MIQVQAVFELRIQRNSGAFVAIFWLAFFLNVLAICSHFPFLSDAAQPVSVLQAWIIKVFRVVTLGAG